jgi:hypothetical protein
MLIIPIVMAEYSSDIIHLCKAFRPDQESQDDSDLADPPLSLETHRPNDD